MHRAGSGRFGVKRDETGEIGRQVTARQRRHGERARTKHRSSRRRTRPIYWWASPRSPAPRKSRGTPCAPGRGRALIMGCACAATQACMHGMYCSPQKLKHDIAQSVVLNRRSPSLGRDDSFPHWRTAHGVHEYTWLTMAQVVNMARMPYMVSMANMVNMAHMS